MLERGFFGMMFAMWLLAITFEVVEQPHNVRLFLLCVKYTFLGLAHVAGLY